MRDHVVDRQRPLVVGGEEPQVLEHGQVREEVAALRHDAEATAPGVRRARGILAEHRHVAGVALAVALEDLDRGRLAGAVRAEQAEHLAGGDREGDAADGSGPAASYDLRSPLTSTAFTAAPGRRRPPAGSRPPTGGGPARSRSRRRPAGDRPLRPSRRGCSTASRTPSGVAPGASRSSISTSAPSDVAERLGRLPRAGQRAREDHGRLHALRRRARRRARRAWRVALLRELAQLVRLAGRGLRVADEQQPHG